MIMNSKITLEIDNLLFEKAQKYASQNGLSLPEVIENYLYTITSKRNEYDSDLPTVTKELRGAFKNSENADYKEILSSQLNKKYIQNG
jgi:hypothetical protein